MGLKFEGPKGNKGQKGEQGPPGTSGVRVPLGVVEEVSGKQGDRGDKVFHKSTNVFDKSNKSNDFIVYLYFVSLAMIG